MEELFRREAPEIVLDATHPYAAEVTKNIRTACENGSIRYQRVLRPEWGRRTGKPSMWKARRRRQSFFPAQRGTFFLTTGSKELSKFTVIPDYQEGFCRVLSILP